MTRALGIDVSSVQGTIDWKRVAAAGVTFAFIKATEGQTYVDPNFAINVKLAREAGLMVGAYHFLSARHDATFQIELFTKTLAPLCPFDLPPVVDFEVPPPEAWGKLGTTGEDLCKRAIEFATAIGLRFTVDPLLYSYPYFLKSLPDCAELDALGLLGLWLAEYSVGAVTIPAESRSPHAPPPWRDWLFWQFSGNNGAKVDGIGGDCDRNVFNGTIEDLRIAFPKTEYP